MISINLYDFSKYENSTKRPSGNGTAFSCKIKSPSSVEEPVVELSTADVSGYNYAYISDFGRYYFIEDCVYDTGFWIVKLKVDVLASYKTEIGNEDLYILRSSAAADGNIRDTYYPIKANNTKYHGYQFPNVVQDHETSIPGDYSSGVIVMNIAGTETAGGSTLWEVLPEDFTEIVKALYVSINGFQLSDVVSKVVQTFGGNPQQLINSAMWFPFPFDVYQVEQVKIGSWYATKPIGGSIVPLTGGIINDPVLLLPDVTFNVPKHPLAATRGNYLNLAPYTQYTLVLPGCGVINLDNNKLQGVTGITIHRYMDAFSGQLFVKVIADSTNQILAYMQGQIGIPIQLRGSNNANSLMGGAASTVGGIVSAITSGGASAIAGAVSAGIGTALEAVGGTPTSSSMGAGFATITDERIMLDTVCFDITDADNSKNGRPLMQVRKPSALGGFMIVQRGDVPITGTQIEQTRIRSYLEGGFYYE